MLLKLFRSDRRRRSQLRCTPSLEALEDRTAPAVLDLVTAPQVEAATIGSVSPAPVEVAPPASLRADVPWWITLSSGSATTHAEPPSLGAVEGVVFFDRNHNVLRDADEPGLGGETVVLEQRQTGQWATVGTTQTDAAGRYAFGGLTSGTYRVRPHVSEPASGMVQVRGSGEVTNVDLGRDAVQVETPGTTRPATEDEGTDPPGDSAALPSELGATLVDRVFSTESDEGTPLLAGLACLAGACAPHVQRERRNRTQPRTSARNQPTPSSSQP